MYCKLIKLSTKGFCDVHNITDEVLGVVKESGVKDGLVCVIVTGSTAGITTLEYEPNLVEDFCELMERLIPKDLETKHGKTWGDDNGFSHLRSALIGTSVNVPIKNAALVLGTWQQIVLCDFDNRSRDREVAVQVIGK